MSTESSGGKKYSLVRATPILMLVHKRSSENNCSAEIELINSLGKIGQVPIVSIYPKP
jgi:hypothetical protein